MRKGVLAGVRREEGQVEEEKFKLGRKGEVREEKLLEFRGRRLPNLKNF